MKALQSSLLRSAAAIVVGVLLVVYREETMKWMTIAMGAMFLLTGLVSCLVYYFERGRVEKAMLAAEARGEEFTERRPMVPIVGLGSIILGGILCVIPGDFIIGVTYALAGMLMLGAIGQIVSLVLARKFWHIPLVFWLFPLIILVVAILVVAHPMEAAALPLKVIGWCMMFYGIVECLNAVMMSIARKRYKAAEEASIIVGEPVEDAVVVEETTAVEVAKDETADAKKQQ